MATLMGETSLAAKCGAAPPHQSRHVIVVVLLVVVLHAPSVPNMAGTRRAPSSRPRRMTRSAGRQTTDTTWPTLPWRPASTRTAPAASSTSCAPRASPPPAASRPPSSTRHTRRRRARRSQTTTWSASRRGRTCRSTFSMETRASRCAPTRPSSSSLLLAPLLLIDAVVVVLLLLSTPPSKGGRSAPTPTASLATA